MTGQEQFNGSLLMAGLDGANPLAFLAALGTLRGLTLAWPERRVRLSWTLRDTWRPRLHTGGCTPSEEETLDGLERFMELRPGHDALEIGDNLPLPSDAFRGHALSAAEAASTAPESRAEADFIAAFGCDAVQSAGRKGQIQETALRTLGAGQTQFLKPMRDLAEKTTREHLRRCLFAPWKREDSRLSLRWDPEDDRRYAHRWRDPTASGEEPKTEWGANRLAFEALPLFPCNAGGQHGHHHRLLWKSQPRYLLDLARLGTWRRSGYSPLPAGAAGLAGSCPRPPSTGRHGHTGSVQVPTHKQRPVSQLHSIHPGITRVSRFMIRNSRVRQSEACDGD